MLQLKRIRVICLIRGQSIPAFRLKIHRPAIGFFRPVFFLVVDHDGFLAAGTAAFLAADFFLFLLARGLDALDAFFDFVAQLAPGEKAVHGLGPFALTLHLDAGRFVQNLDARTGLVHLLPAAAGTANKVLDQVILPDAEALHAHGQRIALVLTDGKCGHNK